VRDEPSRVMGMGRLLIQDICQPRSQHRPRRWHYSVIAAVMDDSSNSNYVIARVFFQKQSPCFNEETTLPKTRNDTLNP